MQHLILVTGMSGAGKSMTLKTLEDLGFEAVDNIPLSILPMLVPEQDTGAPLLAIGMDIRNRDFSVDALMEHVTHFRARKNLKTTLLFLDCEDEILQKRFTETRRKHPITSDRLLMDSIRHERDIISPLKENADHTFDTTELSIHELKSLIKGHFSQDGTSRLSIVIQSFSYRKGIPREADLVFDVRFLKNPFYIPELRDLDGRDEAIAHYIQQDKLFSHFFENLLQLLDPLLPKYENEGKSYLTIAIGCTGGKHRSVFLANSLYERLLETPYEIICRHRELT